MLLNIVKGPKNYDEIKTVNGIVYPTFQSACNTLGLLGDDREWHDALNEASCWITSSELRQLFIILIIYCEIADPIRLLEVHWQIFSDDILYRLKNIDPFQIIIYQCPTEL